MKNKTSYISLQKWQFAARFRRHAFGWRSQTPIQRIKEALTEIRQVARKDPITAAEGAVLFLEKISPALENVDSSSGALGGAVNHAIATLVPIIAKSTVTAEIRQHWLERLWEAIEKDNMPYIEYLEDFWGELCQTPELASGWADEFISMVKTIWDPKMAGHNYFKGTIPCLSSLYFAKRYQELLALLETAPHVWWYYRRFGVKALIALGKYSEALTYAENSRGINTPMNEIDRVCEDILLRMECFDEAYERYAFSANQATTNLATYRAVIKKYPQKEPEDILHDLINSQPGNEGKWFAAAKEAGFYELAMELVTHHPADPRTLARAARDFAEKNPNFAIASGLASLNWMAQGFGYEITSIDVLDAFRALSLAWENAKKDPSELKIKIKKIIVDYSPHSDIISKILMPYCN